MADHRLAIGALTTTVRVLSPDPVDALRQPVQRDLAELLPRLLASATGPVLDRHQGVIRIRTLDLKLAHTGTMDPAQLARMLAARIASALAEALAGHSREAMSWPDHPSYLAAYVEQRLGLRPGPSWPFLEFSALEVLSPAQSAVEILRVSPTTLVTLARQGAARGNDAEILGRLDDDACRELVAALLPPAPGNLTLEGLETMLQWMPRYPGNTRQAAPSRTGLRLALSALAHRNQPSAPPAISGVLATAVILAALSEINRERRQRGSSPLPASALAPELADATEDHPPVIRRHLRAALTDPSTRQQLAAGLPRITGEKTHPKPGTTADQQMPQQVTASPVAGTVLLVPGIAAYRLDRLLSPHQVRRTVLSILPTERQRTAATDPVLAVLFPADPQSPPNPQHPVPGIPPDLTGVIHPDSRHLLTGDNTLDDWGSWLLAEFAGRLPGLRHSSRRYLQDQFIDIHGILRATAAGLQVTLDGPALAIVLSMAGYSGSQGRIPHLSNRSLEIILTGLRP